MDECRTWAEYRGHRIIDIPGDLFDRSPRFAVLEHFKEPVPCRSYRAGLGARAEIDRCIAGESCSAGAKQLDSSTFVTPPRAQTEVMA